MPVATVRMFGSKMMSSAGNPTSWVRMRKARLQMSTRRSTVVAWPSSSNAMTTTAAPSRRTMLAWRTNSASPSLSEIELATPLPWRQRRPISRIENRELSTMTGMRAMSGSAAMRFRKRCIATSPSSIPSSMQTSRMLAPPSTCWRATSTALS